jgi:hypothetical protein
MKLKIHFLLALLISTSLFFTSCSKNNDSATVDENTEMTAHSEDQSMVLSASDEADDDVNAVMDNYGGSFNGGRVDQTAVLRSPCNTTVTVDTSSTPHVITITYNGLSCNGRFNRTGQIKISFAGGFRWGVAGSTMTITYVNFKVTRVVDNRSITINGTKVNKNVTGGLLRNLATAGTIIHEITSNNMSITFDNGSQRLWNIHKQRKFTFGVTPSDAGINIEISGLHTDGTKTGIAEWGTNRFGNPFITQISTANPITIRQACNFRITSGEVVHTRGLRTVTTTFGLDVNGNPTSCPGTAAYYMKIVWVGANGTTVTVIRPYY